MAVGTDQPPQGGESKIPVFESVYYRALVPDLADELETAGLVDLAHGLRTTVLPGPTARIVFRDRVTHAIFEACLSRANRVKR